MISKEERELRVQLRGINEKRRELAQQHEELKSARIKLKKERLEVIERAKKLGIVLGKKQPSNA